MRVVTTLFLTWFVVHQGHAIEPLLQVAIVAQNDGTEITDLLVPFAILSDAGMDVEILATESGPVNLMNGMSLMGLSTIETSHDADLVVIPAVHEPQDPGLLKWIKRAHGNGAVITSVCDGVEVLAATGLLTGQKATGHFYSKARRESKYPDVNWIENVRYVQDGNLISTAGVSASIPASLFLVELLIGAEAAEALAQQYGIHRTHATVHNSDQFSIGIRERLTGVRNFLSVSQKYTLVLEDGDSEFAIALTADALGRTYRASIGIEGGSDEVQTKHGLTIHGKPPHANPDWVVRFGSNKRTVPEPKTIVIDSPAHTIETILAHIDSVFGSSTGHFVATQLEWSR